MRKYSRTTTPVTGIMRRKGLATVFSAMLLRLPVRKYAVVRKRVEVVKKRPSQMAFRVKGAKVFLAQISLS
jgi:hypothetical protein